MIKQFNFWHWYQKVGVTVILVVTVIVYKVTAVVEQQKWTTFNTNHTAAKEEGKINWWQSSLADDDSESEFHK